MADPSQQPRMDASRPESVDRVQDEGRTTLYSRPTQGRTRPRKRLAQLEQKLQHHMDCEDRRVKELTESILYDFLPAALNVMLPHCEDPLQELDADRCRAVAGAALCVSALMNAPPGFLEFLLCVPWRKLSQLYPKSDSIDKLISNLHVTDEERRRLVNTRMDPALMSTMLDFLYREDHLDSVPPMLQLTPVNPAGVPQEDKPGEVVTMETVAALLDGATPLHTAALRGNPAQVDHLLYCGADPTVRTTAGELAIELVPVCGDKASNGSKVCRCMAPSDQEVWECRSHLARSLIARKCAFNFRVGLFAWIKLVFLCLLCCLGHWGRHFTICRPTVEQHVVTRREQKQQEARSRAQKLMARMRSEAEQGHIHLQQAKQECLSLLQERGPPNIDLFNAPPPPPTPANPTVHDLNFHLQESQASLNGDEQASEKSFKCFVRAVHALQSLDLQGDTVPQVFAESVIPEVETRETHVLEDEQADLYCCWAESVLLKFRYTLRACTCPGCAALAVQAVRMAHIQATRLFARVDKKKAKQPDRWKAVGQALARVVYAHICLLLETEVQTSPTKSSVWRAEQCLKEWDKLVKCELTQNLGVNLKQVEALQLWAKTADSDLYIAEALQGSPLTPAQALQEVLQATIVHTPAPNSMPYLARHITPEVVASLEQAITLACTPSPTLSSLAKSVAKNSAGELASAARLRDTVNQKNVPVGTSEAVQVLADAIKEAEVYPRLAAEVETARNLQVKWLRRAEAVDRLDAVIEDVREYTSRRPLAPTARPCASSHIHASSAAVGSGALQNGGTSHGSARSSSSGGGAAASSSSSAGSNMHSDLQEWEQKIKYLEGAINEAKDANISVNKAKKLLKELQAQQAAAEAARQLDAVMSKRPAGPGALKAALSKADTAAHALSGIGGSSMLNESLLQLVQAARKRLDVERAAETLYKAALNYKTVADLQKLEQAILGARKVGAEELDPDAYKAASDLRTRLYEASKARAALDAAVKGLQKQQRQEDAEAVNKALQEAQKWEELLGPDVAKARECLDAWRNQTASEAKLSKALREGANTNALGRAIQEAAAAGIKVQAAKKVLKLMQNLEAAMAATSEGAAAQYAQLKQRIEQGEQGGVSSPLLDAARKMLHKLMVAGAREDLEAALKPHSDWAAHQRISILKASLAKAESVIGGAGMAAAGASSSALSAHSHSCSHVANGAHGGHHAGDAAGSELGSVSRAASSSMLSAEDGTEHLLEPHPSVSGSSADGPAPGAAASCALSRTSTADANGSQLQGHAAAEGMPAEGGPLEASGSGVSVGSGASVPSGALDPELASEVAGVRELVRRALGVLAEDQAELARLEAERVAIEKAKKEQQERERAERARLEQERATRERAEQAEREKALAEKREKAKNEKAAKTMQKEKALKAVEALAAAAAQPHAGGGRGGKGQGKGQARKSAEGGAGGAAGGKGQQQQAARGASSKGGPSAAAVVAGAGKPTAAAVLTGHLDKAAAGKQSQSQGQQQQGQHPGAQTQSQKQQRQVSTMLSPADSAASIQTPLAVSDSSGILSPVDMDQLHVQQEHLPAIPAGRTTYDELERSVVQEMLAVQQPSRNQIYFQHSRGDSLESLGHLHHEMIDALELDLDDAGELSTAVASAQQGIWGNALGTIGTVGGLSMGGAAAPGPSCFVPPAVNAAFASATPSMLQPLSTFVPPSIASVFNNSSMAGVAAAASPAQQHQQALLSAHPSFSTDHHPLEPTNSQRTSSVFSSATSADDATASSATALDTATGDAAAGNHLPLRHALGMPPMQSGEGLMDSLGGSSAATSKPRFGFVDLGGASWGVDNMLMSSGAGPAALFPSLQSSLADFGSMLGQQGADGKGTWSSGGTASGLGGFGADESGGKATEAATGLSLPLSSSPMSLPGLGQLGTTGVNAASAAAGSLRSLASQSGTQGQAVQSQSGSLLLGGKGTAGQGGMSSLGSISTKLSQGGAPGAGGQRANFWTPPTYASGPGGSLLGGDLQDGAGVVDQLQQGMSSLMAEWQGDLGLASGGPGGTPRANRACRYFLQGFCRDGDRCRFSHPASVSASSSLGQLLQVVQGGQGTASAFGTRAPGQTVGNSGLGGFAFGAPGSDAFGRPAEPVTVATVPATSLQLGSGRTTMHAVPANMLAQGLGGNGQQTTVQQVQVRNNITGATFPALLTVSSPVPQPIGQHQQRNSQLQQSVGCSVPSLPDELTFTPSSSPRTEGLAATQLLLR